MEKNNEQHKYIKYPIRAGWRIVRTRQFITGKEKQEYRKRLGRIFVCARLGQILRIFLDVVICTNQQNYKRNECNAGKNLKG